MTALRLGLSIGASSSLRGGGGASASTGAGALLGAETNGLAFAASDDSMEIRDTVTPANAYVGSTITKFGGVRASAAYGYGSTGLIELGPENLISSVFANWLTSNCSMTDNSAVAPDGTTTGTLMTVTNGADPQIYRGVSIAFIAGVYTASVYVKAGTSTFVQIVIYDTGSHTSWFNIATGALGASDAGNTATITPDALGWYRLTVTRTVTAASGYMRVHLSDANNSAVSTVGKTAYVWHSQVNRGSVAHTFIPATESTAPCYGLRRDYDPRVTGPKYLVEEARTNRTFPSNNFSDALWTKDFLTITSNATAGPDGAVTAALLTPAGGATSDVLQLVGTGAGVPTTVSWYFKYGGWRWVSLSLHDGSHHAVWVDLLNGVLGTIDAGVTATITTLVNGWYRVSCTYTIASATPYNCVRFADANNTAVVTPNGTGSYAANAQLEQAAYASSYIPTTSATVTRAQDLPVIMTTAFNYSATANTLYAKFAASDLSGSYVPRIVLSNAAGTSRLAIWSDTNDLYASLTTNPAFSMADVFTVLVDAKAAIGVTGSVNGNAAVNGVIAGTDAAASTMATADRLMLGRDITGPIGNFWMKEGMHLPRRMTNAQLVTVTTP